MKRKSVISFLLGALAFTIAVVLPNELMALAHHVQANDLFEVAPIMGMAVVSLGNIDGSSYSKPNPGGLRTLLIVNVKDITGVWPKAADVVAGTVSVGPVMVTTKTIATYFLPDGTFSLTDSQEGDPGFHSYKQTAGFMLAGFSAAMVAEITKHLNTGSIIIGQLNDGQYAMVGATDNPMYVKTAFNSGSKGADKRGYTCKAEQDGFMWGVQPITPAIVTALTLTPIVL